MRFEVFTQHHGVTVFTTRFEFVARLVTRYVKTLDWAPEGMEAGVDGWQQWWPTEQGRKAVEAEAMLTGPSDEKYENHRDADEELGGPEPGDKYNPALCPDCGHDYLHDAQGHCLYPLEDRVCGWHPDQGPVACPTRVHTREVLEAGRMCYMGRCGRCYGEGCPEYWAGFQKAEQEHLQAIRDHDCERSGCGPVCTAFES
jgi:hypothetical protein